MSMDRLHAVVGPLQTNVYVLADPASREAIAIDTAIPCLPWISGALEERGWSLRLIVSTHGHWDHVGAKGIYESIPHMTLMSVTSGFSVSGGTLTNPGHYNTTSTTLSEDLSIVRGSHQFGVGVSWVHELLNSNSGVARSPSRPSNRPRGCWEAGGFCTGKSRPTRTRTSWF